MKETPQQPSPSPEKKVPTAAPGRPSTNDTTNEMTVDTPNVTETDN
jgi:hypothetical protein